MLIAALEGIIDSEEPLGAVVDAAQAFDFQARGLDCSLDGDEPEPSAIISDDKPVETTTTDVEFHDLTDSVGAEVARDVLKRALGRSIIAFSKAGIPLSADDVATLNRAGVNHAMELDTAHDEIKQFKPD